MINKKLFNQQNIHIWPMKNLYIDGEVLKFDKNIKRHTLIYIIFNAIVDSGGIRLCPHIFSFFFFFPLSITNFQSFIKYYDTLWFRMCRHNQLPPSIKQNPKLLRLNRYNFRSLSIHINFEWSILIRPCNYTFKMPLLWLIMILNPFKQILLANMQADS